MNELIDITLPLDRSLPIWPGTPGFELVQIAQLARDGHNETQLQMGSHVGTHIDAPRHFLAEGNTVEQLELQFLIGNAYVAECSDVQEISSEVLERLELPIDVERLLLKTDNSKLWAQAGGVFYKDYVALTREGAEWLVQRGIRLIGIDYLSIQRFDDTNATHATLLGADIIVLEGLNLASTQPGPYELICLPLPVVGAEGAPVRAVLRKLSC